MHQLVMTALWAVATLSWTKIAPAQTLNGRVLDDVAGDGVPQASVLVLAHGDVVASSPSDESGAFNLRLPSYGTFVVRAVRLGYLPSDSVMVTIGDRGSADVTLRMTPTVVALDPVTVTVRRGRLARAATYEGLYARRAVVPPVGSERVVVKGDYQLDNAMTVEDVLSQFLPTRGCVVFFVNGRARNRYTDAIDGRYYVLDMPAAQLEGVEFYRDSLTAPLDYQGYGCWAAARYSIVAVWLRL